MSSITTFNFVAQSVRVVMISDAPWFVAADVCAVLELPNSTMALKRLDADEIQVIDFSTLNSIEGRENQRLSNFNPKTINIINESGLYSLMLTSRKPAAKRLKKWVTSEVLPAIRRTGEYRVNPIHTPSDDLAKLRAQRDLLWSWLIELKPEIGKIARYRTAGLTQKEVARALAWGVKRVRKAEKRLDSVGLLPKCESMQLMLLED